MAKEEKEKPEVKIEKPKEEKETFFPKLLILFSLVVIAAAVIDYFKFYQMPKPALDIILLLAGLWMLKVGVEKGFYRKRKEIFKKYI